MAPYRTNGQNSGKARPYMVERPSESERIGPALRMAYTGSAVPADMAMFLEKLDTLTPRER